MRFDEKVPVGGAITRTALRALPDVAIANGAPLILPPSPGLMT